ncbi:hypothetical protein BaRGS_00029057 [Batillaria attramentaria]|uniref:Uncharacterized protein n=1 Tax=Batillaria attramentaria TaxID=370345 RepID=A0ABD0JY62_9CAEN
MACSKSLPSVAFHKGSPLMPAVGPFGYKLLSPRDPLYITFITWCLGCYNRCTYLSQVPLARGVLKMALVYSRELTTSKSLLSCRRGTPWSYHQCNNHVPGYKCAISLSHPRRLADNFSDPCGIYGPLNWTGELRVQAVKVMHVCYKGLASPSAD